MSEEKKDDHAEGKPAASSVPEVEAEIVGDLEVEDKASILDDGEADDSADPDPAKDNAPVKRKALTPGVYLFIAFVLLSIGALIFWRLNDASAPSSDHEERSAPINPEETVSMATSQSVSPLGSETTPAADPVFIADIASSAEPPKAIETELIDGGSDIAALDLIEAELNANPQTEEMLAAQEATNGEMSEAATQTLPAETIQSETAPEESLPNAPMSEENAADDVSTELQAAGDEDDAREVEREASAQALADLEARLEAERAAKDDLRAEIEALQAAFEARENEQTQAANREIARLEAALEQRRAEDSPSAQRRAAGAEALIALEAALETGRPYDVEVETLARLSPEADGLDLLRRYAGGGAPKDSALQEGFAAAARAGLSAAREKEGGPVARLIARAQNLISVRPSVPRPGNTPRAIMSRAEAAVETMDYAAALAELEALSPGVRAAMKDWMEHARASVEIDAGLRALSDYYFGGTETR